jgi:hypothetical protein
MEVLKTVTFLPGLTAGSLSTTRLLEVALLAMTDLAATGVDSTVTLEGKVSEMAASLTGVGLKFLTLN